MDRSADQELGERCRATADAAIRAIAWLADNRGQVGQEQASLERQFRKSAVTARKLATAAERPMCVGVFGPSQAGKSYLISVMARPGREDLFAEFEGTPGGFNFLRDINPEGGTESTGLVTRFTIVRKPTPPGYPVALRLLSELDVVKILMNTYLLDIDRTDEPVPRPEQIQAAISEVRQQRLAEPQDRLSIEDFYDLHEYVERYFRGNEYVRLLSAAGLWRELEQLGPYLPVEARVKLLAFLWGQHEPFTRVYRALQAGLKALDFPAEAFAPIEALRKSNPPAGVDPRIDSIIDVRTLFQLDDAAGSDRITLTTQEGRTAELARPVVAALVAELRIVATKKPWPFFEHTDLLDFPGARSRKNETAEKFFASADGVAQLFLRGKVAYLFERYCAELELTAMLLCLPDSNLEVTGLPKMVADWIAATHGPTPTDRARQQTALFFVLTKFDTIFASKAGEGELSQRFKTRMNASLLDPFSIDAWPVEWTPKQPFDNCFWLRNPQFRAEVIIRYDAEGKEVELLADKAGRIAQLKEAYLSVDTVQRHFRDADRAWEEALKLNDGGVSYLAANLDPVCNPDIKRRQVAARLGDLVRTLLETLQRYHVSDDIEAEKQKRIKEAYETLSEIEVVAEEGRFGDLMTLLQLEHESLMALYHRISSDPDGEAMNGDAEPVVKPRGSGRLLGMIQNAGSPTLPAGGRPSLKDRPWRFAEAAVEAWIDEIRQAAQSDEVARALGISNGALAKLVSELAQGSARLDLRGRIAQRVREINSVPQQQRLVMGRCALVASEIVNGYLAHLGIDELPAEARPQVPDPTGQSKPVFLPVPAVNGLPQLPEERIAFNERVIAAWMASYLKLVELSASSLDDGAIDREQNQRLGLLLANLRSVEGGSAALQ